MKIRIAFVAGHLNLEFCFGLQKDHKAAVKDLLRENEDLKERLNMASTEYKTLYIEKKKVQKALERAIDKSRSLYCTHH